MIKRLLIFILLPTLLLAACSASSDKQELATANDLGRIVKVYRAPT